VMNQLRNATVETALPVAAPPGSRGGGDR
jgi:hypothetical protein